MNEVKEVLGKRRIDDQDWQKINKAYAGVPKHPDGLKQGDSCRVVRDHEVFFGKITYENKSWREVLDDDGNYKLFYFFNSQFHKK